MSKHIMLTFLVTEVQIEIAMVDNSSLISIMNEQSSLHIQVMQGDAVEESLLLCKHCRCCAPHQTL